jgi:hypothetical protein
MAIYTFRNKKTGRTKEYEMPIKEYDQFKIDNPHLERIIDPVGIGFQLAGQGNKTITELAAKRDPAWGEVLSKIGQQNLDSPLNSDFAKNKTIKRLRAEAVVEKHAKMQEKQRKERARKVKN